MKLTLILRILLGVLLLVFGINKFAPFLPAPEPTGDAAVYLGGLMASGFTFPVIGILEIVVGIALLTNKYVPLALVLFAPISVNILLFHVSMDMGNIPIGGAVFALNLALLFLHKKSYNSLLSA
jgi:uncharacterized membrane protein YphA (DoxX/SURF4 family)